MDAAFFNRLRAFLESRTALIIGGLALALLTAWWLWGGAPAAPAARILRGDVAQVVYATGVVEPLHWAKITAPQRKRITELCACEGQEVRKGEVLARLDDAAEQAQLRELEARLTRLRDDAERLEKLVARNVASRTSLDEKQTQIEEHEARIAAQKTRIAELALKAPMDGVVLRRDGEVGEIASVGADQAILWVGRPKPLRLAAEVNEEDVFGVRAGQKALLRHDGQSGRALPATVKRITPKGDPENKTFRVYLTLPDDTPLMIGMNVEANIITAEAKGVTLAPAEAIQKGRVQRVENGRVYWRAVETGLSGGALVEIRAGLREGDLILSPPRQRLSDGDAVAAETP